MESNTRCSIYIDQYHVNVMIVSAMQRKTDATNDNAGSVLLPLPPWDEMKGVADVLWSDSGFHSPLNLNYHIHQRLSWNTCQRWSVSWPPTFHPASAVGSPHLCKSLPVQPWVYNKQKPIKAFMHSWILGSAGQGVLCWNDGKLSEFPKPIVSPTVSQPR